MDRRNALTRIALSFGLPACLPFPKDLEIFQDLHGNDFEWEQTWVTKDGRHIKVRELEDEHLRNIIFFLNKQFALADLALGAEPDSQLMRRPQHPGEIWPMYDVVRREANRRKLSWI